MQEALHAFDTAAQLGDPTGESNARSVRVHHRERRKERDVERATEQAAEKDTTREAERETQRQRQRETEKVAERETEAHRRQAAV